ncbi:hypothetical protein COX93_01915, partial [Candidatus Nomurabacteria bacterium CG_4_10_14_0_2_um_filter_30_12]
MPKAYRKKAIAFFSVLYPHTYFILKDLQIGVGVYIMDNMLGEDKNLKDTSKDSVKDTLSQPVNSMSLVSSWQ